MKAYISLLLLLSCMSLAYAESPLMIKEQTSDDVYHQETCYFFSNKVKVVKSDGHGGVTSEFRRTNYPRKVLGDLIQAALAEEMEEVSARRDINVQKITAFRTGVFRGQEVLLQELDGFSTTFMTIRKGPASAKLINIANFVCPDID